MNELHVEYRKIGGYTLDDSCTISSRGYCDDTAILADNMQTLQRLNDCTTSFFNKHGLKLNHTKTYLIGRNADGSPSTTPLRWKDQHTDLLIHPRDHTYAIRYLGLHLNMDLTWNEQISRMNRTIMGMISHLRYGRITLLQGAILLRYVIGKKMEIGFRHAIIPDQTLSDWNKYIKDALTRSTHLHLPQLHTSAIMSCMAVLTFDRTYSLDKFMHIMESLNTDTEIQHYYQQLYQTTYDNLGAPHTTNTSDLTQAIHTIHKQNIHVIQNKSFSRTETASSSDHATSSTILNFKGYPIPIDTNLSEIQHLWGAHYTSDPNAMALICTDGSTNLAHPVEGSGAAFIFADDTLHRHEYDNAAASWVLGYSDNYAAELSALNGAIRSVPSTVHLTVYTDSLSAKQALERYIPAGPPPLSSVQADHTS